LFGAGGVRVVPNGRSADVGTRPFADVWRGINRTMPVEATSVRILCLVFAVTFGIIAWSRRDVGDAILTWPRLAICAYALLGAVLATRFRAVTLRAFTVVFAIGVPVFAVYVSADEGSQAAFALSLLALAPVLFLQTGRDLAIVLTALAASVALLAWGLPEPAMGGLTHWLVWLGAVAVAASLRFSLLVYRSLLYDATIDLNRARQRALDATRAKSEFLANMRHEVRTPLTSVIGMAELLMTTELDDEQREYVEMSRAASLRLMTILDDILDLSRVESGSLNIEPVAFDLRALMRAALTPLELRARGKSLVFDWEIAADVSEVVAGDPKRIRQVLVNLVNNAIRFTENGEVHVRVRRADADEGEERLHFTISDTGIGISVESQDRVFEAFTQADGSSTRIYGGAGIGLAMSAELVELMHGEIWLQSEAGAGSTFHFTARLPAAEGLAEDLEISADAEDEGPIAAVAARVLVAEDNPVNRAFAVAVLRRAGHEVLPVVDGKEALAAFDDEPFDLVLLDLQMPELDGLELAAAIRERERRNGGHVPIIAVTAHDEAGQIATLREMGMDAHLNKPFRGQDLLETIDRLLPRDDGTAERPASQSG